ncbi:citrate:proton symporter [Acidaminococcus sp. NSJ-142]|uniref:CitMHS family transporter n=1 Tax=Acidaminococcus TaxID=904 RepID=UPI000CF9CC99|nr:MULTISPECIES: citrate:proton symporter [Acidaminococcus]MCD2435716.1 citrate:proton symporter [Acidaminococcus hominis]
MFLGIVGLLMIFLIVYLLISGKSNAMVIFVIVPIIAALLCGFAPAVIFEFLKKGVGTTMSTAVLFLFSIVYFGIMNDVGLFDPLIKFLVKRAGSNIVLITVATGVIATVAHLDGTTAGTMLITIPAMLPLYKKLHIRPVVLGCIISAAISIMNLVPWGGPTARTAIVTNTDVNALWQELLPLQGVGIVLVLAFAAYLGIMEKKRGAGLNPTGKAAELSEEMEESGNAADKAALKRPNLLWFNALVTLGVILLMCLTKIPLYGAFMIGLALVLAVNFKGGQAQLKAVSSHASAALTTPMILLTTGVFLGILNGTKMLTSIANILVDLMPQAVGAHLPIVIGALSGPIGMLLGTDSFFFGFMPLVLGMGERFAASAHDIAMAMLIGKDFTILVTPHNATTFLLIGLTGVSIKEHLKFCTPYLWIMSWITLACAVVLGIVHI